MDTGKYIQQMGHFRQENNFLLYNLWKYPDTAHFERSMQIQNS